MVERSSIGWRPSLALKVGTAMGAFVLLVVGSLHHSYEELHRSSLLVDEQYRRLAEQQALIDQQVRLLASQVPLFDQQATALNQQKAAVGNQLRLLGDQRQSMRAQSDALGSHWTAVEMSRLFSDLRYWLSDHALSGRSESLELAQTAKVTLDQRLDLLVFLGVAEEQVVDAIRGALDAFLGDMNGAARAFAENDSRLAQQFIASARQQGALVSDRLAEVLTVSDQAVVGAAKRTLDATQRIEANAGDIRTASSQLAGIVDSVHTLGTEAADVGRLVKRAGVQVAATADAVQNGHQHMEQKSLALMIVAAMGAALIALYMVRVVVVPITRLAALMDDVTAGDLNLTQRLKPIGADELVRLASSFNRMLETLEKNLHELRQQKSFFEAIFHNVPDAMVIATTERRMLMCNPGMTRVFGYEAEDLVGHSTELLYANRDEFERLGRVRYNAHSLPNPVPHEAKFKRRDGEIFDAETVGTVIKDNQGESLGMLGLMRDVTMRKQAEAALRASEEKYRKANDELEARVGQRTRELQKSEQRFKDFASSAADWYWEMDEQLRFHYFSDRFTEITGVDPEQLLGKTREQTGIPEVDAETWINHLDDLANHRPFRNFIHPRTRSSGKTVWLAINGTPIVDEQQQFMGYRGTGTDITSQVEAEAALIRAKEISEQAAKAKSEFLANMSHEIRTPMNGIIGMTELLFQSDLPGDSRRYVDLLNKSATTLLALIDDVLDFSKIEAGKLELEKVDFDLRALLDDVTEIFGVPAGAKGLELALEVAPGTPAFVVADPIRLRQVLNNLLSNAIKFTQLGGVTLRARGKVQGASASLQFTVEDTGIGMAPQNCTRIFDEFVQADGTATREHGGTGLGLAISKRLVELMGGSIAVESSPGAGSRFTFDIQADVTQRVSSGFEPSPTNTAPEQLRGLTVLVAEDNSVNQLVAERMLERVGCRLILASNGLDAVQAVEDHAVDLILMDCQMPEMDGFQATRKIREQEQARHRDARPIVALTANALDGDRQRCLAAGMNAYLSKPFTYSQLIEVLTKAWEARSQRSSPTSGTTTLTTETDSPDAASTSDAPAHNRSSQSDAPACAQPGHDTELPALDPDVVSQIHAMEAGGASGFFRELAKSFESSSVADLEALRGAVEHGDADGIRQAAHKLKSGSGVMGALRLASLCQQLEGDARAAQVAGAEEMLTKITDEHRRVAGALSRETDKVA